MSNKKSRAPIGVVFIIFGIILLIAKVLSSTMNKLPKPDQNFNDITFLFFGILFILVGIIITAISVPTEKQLLRELIDKQEQKTEIIVEKVKIRCTNCKTLNDEDAKFCKSCGKTL